MNDAVRTMFEKYRERGQLESRTGYLNALREIIQELALLGLWRMKFFERAAFYGGTALRIAHGLDRYSEDLDFSLLKPDHKFDLLRYCDGLAAEIESHGFIVKVEKRKKTKATSVDSAFIKGNTIENLLSIGAVDAGSGNRNETIKIKLDVDVDPPGGFETEAVQLFSPIPFSVNIYKPCDLFAGKISAVLFRAWKHRVKGRDWYDLVWFAGTRDWAVNLDHLKKRMVQTGAWPRDKKLTRDDLVKLLEKRIDEVDFEDAKKDVLPFLRDKLAVKAWSKEFFRSVAGKIKTV
ncbi:MAG: hypothetical protein A2583_01240 [Bdellovibrionales bacterium RIFOXYD1_FULL_53_11]|nr:MAG: hypothetical protein A2583_01240 [Bdellovibrionales bacterium RIFOXYD1_FULL_53_11]